LASELLAAAAGIDIVHVPYRGGGAAAPHPIAGRGGMMFDSSNAGNVAGRHLRAPAGTPGQRMKQFPDVPTVAEQSYPGFSASAWFAIWTTDGSPAACIDRISHDVSDVLKDDTVQSRFAALGAFVVGTSPAEAARFLDAEAGR